MHLPEPAATTFIKGYTVVLSQIHDLMAESPKKEMLTRLAAARARLVADPSLLDTALRELSSRSIEVPAEVVAALRSLEVKKWVYLKDGRSHSVFIDPSGERAFGVLGLTQALKNILGGAGAIIETGIVSYLGHYVTDALVSSVVWLGPNYRKDFSADLARLRKSGGFHVVPPDMSPTLPPGTPLSRNPAALLQLRVELAWITPAIWRRILVPASITLPELHEVLQYAMGWSDEHLYQFKIGRERYDNSDLDFDGGGGPQIAPSAALGTVLGRRKSFTYIYDFGDHWEHQIQVEKRLPPDPARAARAICVDGANAAPPEDIGGARGYGDFLEALRDPRHPAHEDMQGWLEDGFDPAHFDLAAVNLRLETLKISA